MSAKFFLTLKISRVIISNEVIRHDIKNGKEVDIYG